MEENNASLNIEAIMDGIRDEIRQEQAASLNVEQIVAEIRAQVNGKPKPAIPDFSEVRATPTLSAAPAPAPAASAADGGVRRQICNEAQYLKGNSYNPYYQELGAGLKAFVKRVIRRLSRCVVLPLNERQNAFNLHAANGVDALRIGYEYHEERIDALTARLEQQARQIESLTARLDQNERDLQEHGRELAGHRETLRHAGEGVARLNQAAAAHEDRLAAHADGLAAQQKRLDAVDKSIDDIGTSVARVIRHYMDAVARPAAPRDDVVEAPAQDAPEAAAEPAKTSYEGLDYFKFQNDFRGTQTQIMERQRRYVPYFKGRTGKVFDLGCGRGEFLRLMKAEGIPAFGADTYAEYEVTGRLYDVDIRVGDGIAMLEQVAEPLGGVFCGQVIEHLGFGNVDRLCRLAYRKLEEGACLVLETPNPMCVSTFTNGFYIDPTHDKPVHPLLMEYLLKSIGFSKVELVWPDQSLEQLPEIRGQGIENLDEVNRAIHRVSGLLYGSQDYAVIAVK